MAAWLSAQHAGHQESVANNLIVALFPLWQIMRFDDLDASTVPWLEAVLPRVETAFLQSQRLSGVFNANVRFAELPVDEPIVIDVPEVQFPLDGVPRWAFQMPETEPEDISSEIEYAKSVAGQDRELVPAVRRDADPLLDRLSQERNPFTPKWVLDRIKHLEDVRAGRVSTPEVQLQEFQRSDVATSLTIEGNSKVKRAMPGPEPELMRDGLVRSSGAAIRQAMNGGRGVTNRVMAKDRKVIGFARVTDSDPCAFCALLASRGTVFGKGSFVSSDAKFKADDEAARDVPDGWTNIAKVHNNCKCHLRPVYANESRWDAGAKHFLKLWNDREVRPDDVMEVLKRNPNLKGYPLQRAVDIRAFKRKLEANPFRGNQFDLNTMRRDLRERMDGLLDAGFSPGSPQYRWAERTSGLVA